MLINSWLTLVKNSLQKSNSRSSAKSCRKRRRSVVSTQPAAEMLETRALLTANLLVDGGFELGQQTPGTATVANPGHSWGAWTSSDSTTALLGMPYAGMATYEGVEAMHLGNGYGPGAVNQFFATTIGVEYEVSLAIKGWLNGSGHVRATLTNGANTDLVANFHNPGGAWVSNTFSFIATGTSTNIKLQNVSGASTIDDVSVVPNVAAVMSIGDASVTEGNSGTKVLSFPVTLSNPVDEAVSVDYATQNVDSQVVVTVAPTSGPTTLQGATGLTSTGIILEPGMTVTVTATGTATWGGPTLVMTPNGWAGGGYPLAGSGFFLPNVPAFGLVAQIGDAAPVFVGSGPIVLSGAGELRFAVNDDAYGDNRGTGFVVTSTVSLAPNAATAGSDYVAKTGTLTIPAGSTTGTINITVNGDTVIEPDETLRVLLSNLQANGRDVQLQGPQFFATGTIINDDFNTPPTANADSVATDEASTVTFNVLGNDSDAENNIVASLTAAISAPTAGVLTDNGSGSFTFNPSGAFESLAAGDSAQVSFGYRIEDAYGATSTATVIITINGVNDAATISGNNAGTLTEDGTGDSGSLSVSDVDNGESVFQPQTGVTGIYGTFSIDAAGNWSYTRTSNLDAMNAGDVLADGFTVVSADGTASQLVTITITGVNDIASITGDNAGSMTEDGSGDSGVLTVSDLDDAENVFQPQTSVTGTYGTFSINAAGNWSYTRTSNLDVTNAGDVLNDSFTVVSADGTDSKVVTVTRSRGIEIGSFPDSP